MPAALVKAAIVLKALFAVLSMVTVNGEIVPEPPYDSDREHFASGNVQTMRMHCSFHINTLKSTIILKDINGFNCSISVCLAFT